MENPIVEEIVKETKIRNKRKDKSIIPDKKIVEEIIENYADKVDLAKKFLELIPLYYDRAGLWWRWKSGIKRWEIVDEVDILNLIKNTSRANVINSKEKTEILNAFRLAARGNKPKETKSNWIQFNDEIVDLETGKRFEATSEYFVTNPIPWNLGEIEDTPTIDKIFEEWVGKDYVQTLYEILAYCLVPDYPIHRLFCFIGEGMNGKSCFLDLIRIFLGEHNVCSTELDVLLNSRFEVTRLHRKLVCVMGETNFNEMSKTSMLKKLTGGDLIGFEYKNKTPFEDKNYAKILISTNNLPTTSDKTIGFYRRWSIIDFPNAFTEKKQILKSIPEEEYNNLALKCIGVLIEVLGKREFHNEGTIQERAKKYEDKSDPLQKFLEEYTLEDINQYITKADFYKKFNEWAKENRFRQIAETTIGKKMKEKGIETSKKRFDWMNDGRGGEARIWVGIAWKV